MIVWRDVKEALFADLKELAEEKEFSFVCNKDAKTFVFFVRGKDDLLRTVIIRFHEITEKYKFISVSAEIGIINRHQEIRYKSGELVSVLSLSDPITKILEKAAEAADLVLTWGYEQFTKYRK